MKFVRARAAGAPARCCHPVHVLRVAVAAALAAGASMTIATAAPAPVPPLVEPANQEHHVGMVVFVELVTPDLAASERFYAGMFDAIGTRSAELFSQATARAIALNLDGSAPHSARS